MDNIGKEIGEGSTVIAGGELAPNEQEHKVSNKASNEVEIGDVPIPSINECIDSHVKETLSTLADSFEGFEQSLIKHKKTQQHNEDKRFEELHIGIKQLEASLNKESKRRNETLKALEAMSNERMSKLKEEIQTPIDDKLAQIKKKSEDIQCRIKVLAANFDDDLKNFPKQINERSRHLLKQLKEFKMRFQAEQALRENREKELVHDIERQHRRVQDQFENERFVRAKRFSIVNEEIAAEARTRLKETGSIREHVSNQLATAKASIEDCNKQRVRDTAELTKAIVHYAAALQDGVNAATRC